MLCSSSVFSLELKPDLTPERYLANARLCAQNLYPEFLQRFCQVGAYFCFHYKNERTEAERGVGHLLV